MSPRPEDSARRQIAGVAAAMVAGETDLLAGCRSVVRLRCHLPETEADDAALLVLVAAESELQDVPPDHARKYWADDYLATLDRKKAEFLEACREDILQACLELIRRWNALC